MSQDSQPDHTDELLGRMDALLGKHRPADASGDEDDIPVLTEVVIEIEEPDPDIPVLQDLAPEFDSAAAFAEQDTFDIPVLEEALPDSLADLTAFSLEEGEPEVELHIDPPPAREPELVLQEPAPTGLEITLELPDLPLLVDEAPVLMQAVAAPVAVRHSDIAAITDEILADVDAGLSARVESIVRRQFALTLAELYRTSLNDALQTALQEIRQDLRSTVEQVVAEQLSRREHD
ncbi:MAG: hypothetical protein RL210_664 [Pseudomonadota bacterium]|jgi:hypothetical protein